VKTPEVTPLESSLSREVEALRLENRLLRERVDLLVRKVFGSSVSVTPSAFSGRDRFRQRGC